MDYRKSTKVWENQKRWSARDWYFTVIICAPIVGLILAVY